jgi:hypothetical protein
VRGGRNRRVGAVVGFPAFAAAGVFTVGPNRPAGMSPTRVGRVGGLGTTPALYGMFRAGRTVGVSQINAMATNIRRGGG